MPNIGRARWTRICRSGAGLVLIGLGLIVGRPVGAVEPSREQVEFFEKKVRPVLAERCYSCHSQAAGKKKAGLVVDSLGGLLKGGSSGAALVPGHPDKSLLIKAVSHGDPDLKMPPKDKLTDAQIAVLTQWVKMGAPWPGSAAARAPGRITAEDRAWWAFQPLRRPAPPEVDDRAWSHNPIDRFVYRRLRAEGLRPSPPARRAALIRRVYFDLVGLPPTPEEVDAFVADRAPDAYEKLVDRLLASPRYGERWARHWLDLARYAESDGFRADEFRPNAWHYRDYVIRAFNADKPYDRFVQEQLAGDELWPDDPDAHIATGFLRHWMYEYNQRDVRVQWDNILNDLTDVTGDVFLGLGMGCARCHDHKFDPILQKDYYRLQAFFAAILPRDDVSLATAAQQVEYREQLARWQTLTAAIRNEIEKIEGPARTRAERGAIDKFPDDIQALLRRLPSERTPLEQQLAALAYRQVRYEFDHIENHVKGAEKQRLIALKQMLAAVPPRPPAPLPTGMTVLDVGQVAPPTVIPRKSKGQPIEPGYLTLFSEDSATIRPVAASTGRRAELARWITRPDNPLSTRVIVNRVWQYHFGRGVAATSSDFGRLGEKPADPELLDWLAIRFVEDGWSFKKLHRLVVTSASYRQSATAAAPAAALKVDPENRLLWRMSTRRLDAEQIRDAVLWATGELELTAGGPGVDPRQPRRTIYTRVLRNTREPLLDVFDLPEGFTSTAQRNVTTTPTQSLLLINSPYMLQRARALADRLGKDRNASDEQRVDAAIRLTFGRAPTVRERDRLTAFLRDQGRRDPPAALVALCHVLLNANEFLYID